MSTLFQYYRLFDGNKKNKRARNDLSEAVNKIEIRTLKIASHFSVIVALSVSLFPGINL